MEHYQLTSPKTFTGHMAIEACRANGHDGMLWCECGRPATVVISEGAEPQLCLACARAACGEES